MENITDDLTLPERARQILALGLTILGVLLYAAILGSCIVRTYLEGDPAFSDGTLKASALLSGLVGAVVTAGFARSSQSEPEPITAKHPLGGYAQTGWLALDPPSRARRKFMGLARILGMHITTVSHAARPTEEQEAEQKRSVAAAVWVAALYFAVYLILGAAAFGLAVLRPTVPELIFNAAWVWLGTVLSAGYSFFALGN